MQKVDYLAILRLLRRPHRVRLLAFAFLRVVSNALDLAALAGIAVLSSAFASFTTTSGSAPVTSIPLIGQVVIGEREAVLVALFIAGTFLVKSIFSIALQLQTTLTVAEIETELAERLTRKYFERKATASTNSVDTVAKFQTNILVASAGIANSLNAGLGLLTEGTLVVALIIVFFVVNPLVTLATLLYLGIIVVGLNYLMNFRLKRNSYRIVEGSEESLTASRDLFGVKREVVLAGVAENWLGRIVAAKRKAAFSTGLNYVLNSLPRFFLETALVFGIFAFLGGIVVFSDLPSQAVTAGVFLAGGLRLVAAILPFQLSFNGIIAAAATANDAVVILKDLPNPNESQKTHATAESRMPSVPIPLLTFSDVDFAYGEEKKTLDQVTFAAMPMTKTAIVGPSGAGKTTVFELANGFRDPDRGQISVGDEDFSVEIDQLPHGYLAIVPQRPQLVTGSLGFNVSLELDSGFTGEQITDALAKAGLGEFLDQQTEGLEVMIRPDSGQLSGGEIQRLGLARALLRKPKILFLDEATSALDAETENRISAVLDELRSEMTVVLIAHRLSTVMNADNIIYLNKGKVVAQGTFAELKKNVPDFAKAVELMDLGD